MRRAALVMVALAVACDTPAATPDAGPQELTDDLSMPAEPTLSLDSFAGAAECADCHPDHVAQWRTSMHGYALTDPVYRRLVEIRQADFDGLQDRFCLQCHSPIGTRGGDVTPGFEFADLAPITLEGVTCSGCHKVASVARTYNSGHVIDEDGPLRGPIDDPMENAFHDSEGSELFAGSELCGGCHDVVEVSGLALERPYDEWLASPAAAAGQSCQDCHMPTRRGQAAPGGPERTLHDHRWVGVDLPLTGGTLSADELADLRDRVEALLAGSGSVTLEAADSVTAGEQLDLYVTVANNIPAHDLPTGSTFNRQLWLEVTATDSAGKVVYRTGDLDANGDLRDYYSELDPYGDQDLIVFGSRFIDNVGDPVLFSWRASDRISTSLSPLYRRTFTLFVPTTDAAAGPLTIEARLRFRSFPPYLLRRLDLGDEGAKLPIYDIDATTLQTDVAP